MSIHLKLAFVLKPLTPRCASATGMASARSLPQDPGSDSHWDYAYCRLCILGYLGILGTVWDAVRDPCRTLLLPGAVSCIPRTKHLCSLRRCKFHWQMSADVCLQIVISPIWALLGFQTMKIYQIYSLLKYMHCVRLCPCFPITPVCLLPVQCATGWTDPECRTGRKSQRHSFTNVGLSYVVLVLWDSSNSSTVGAYNSRRRT